jgi:hypothetical protein
LFLENALPAGDPVAVRDAGRVHDTGHHPSRPARRPTAAGAGVPDDASGLGGGTPVVEAHLADAGEEPHARADGAHIHVGEPVGPEPAVEGHRLRDRARDEGHGDRRTHLRCDGELTARHARRQLPATPLASDREGPRCAHRQAAVRGRHVLGRGDVGGRRVGREGGVGRVVVDAAVENRGAVLADGPVGRGGVGCGPDVLPVSTGGGGGGAAVRERGERREQEGTQRRDHGLARAHRGTSIGEGSAWPF